MSSRSFDEKNKKMASLSCKKETPFFITGFINSLCFLEDGVCADQTAEYDGNGGDQLDEDVEGRTGGVLKRIADGVADNGCLVAIAALTAVLTGFNVLLGVIPSTACVGHEYCHNEAADRC